MLMQLISALCFQNNAVLLEMFIFYIKRYYKEHEAICCPNLEYAGSIGCSPSVQ